MSIVGNFIAFRAYYNHGKGNTEKALELYKKAEEKNMTKPNYKLAYGVLLLRTGDYKKCETVLEGLLEKDSIPERVKDYAKMNLALSYWKQGNISTAVELMEEVHESLKNTSSYQTYGYLLIESGQLYKALEFNLKALDYDDSDPVILDNVGQSYYKMGNLDEAMKYFLKALDEKENQADSLYYLGCIYMEQGRYEEAKEKLNSALENNTSPLCTISNDKIKEKLDELASISGTTS